METSLPALVLAMAIVGGPALAFTDAEATAVRASEGLEVRWSAEGPVDVFVADRPSVPLARMRRLSNDDRDGVHRFAAANGERPYLLLRHERTGRTVRLAERVVPLEAGSNFRDLGGYPASGGKRVRWGRIFRTAAMPKLTAADERTIAALGVRSLVDLRSLDERQMSPTDWRALGVTRHFAVDYSATELFGDGSAVNVVDLYARWPLALKSQYRRIFEDLLAGEGPVMFNCSAGQDRTGLAAALVLSALGVPRDVILADYHLSTTHRRPQFEFADVDLAALAPTNAMARFMLVRSGGRTTARPQPLLDPSGEALLMAALRRIETDYGSVESYLAVELDVDAADVARLRSLYLE